MYFSRKTSLLIIALLAGLIVLLVVASNVFVAHNLSSLEQVHARQHQRSIKHLYENEVGALAALATDWANWDDTYRFMAEGDQDYLASNYTVGTFQTLNLSLVVLGNLEGRVIFSMAYDAQAERKTAPPPSLQAGALAPLLEAQRSEAGLLNLPEGPLLFAAEPILTSARTGPPRGVLLFGRWLDDEQLSYFEEVTGDRVALFPWQADSLPADFAEARAHLADDQSAVVRTLNADEIAVYTVLPDVYGNPAVILRTLIERDIYQHGLASRMLFTALLIVFGGVTGLVIIMLVRQMQEQGQELSDILNSSADPIAVLSPDGTIQNVNTAFEATCGVGRRSLFDLICPEHSDHKQALQEGLSRAAALQATRRVPEVTFQCRSATREQADFEVVFSPVRSRLRRSPRLIATLHDLTPQKQAEAHLRNALNREIEINRLKTQFLSMASHEFGTPLAVIMTSADILERYWQRQTEEERQKRFSQIRLAVQTMRQITDDLLAHLRTETGALEVRPEPTDIYALCERLVREFSLSQEKDVSITFQGSPSPLMIQADPNLIALIVRNLLSNAVKYSPAGKAVTLSIAQDAGYITLTVRDEGMGIPLDEQSHLFTPFFRASNVGRIPGSGLGLSIVKKAVELQGGSIGFESVPGQGTTFRVTLPHSAPVVVPRNGHAQALPVAPQN